ncbi:SMP-30/gluconolactonase/LRE family protein [Actinoplanes siamensis]|nr:SMP-30/gluconolactonase/LRE family protein [Actinoplanes siamensis]
MTTSEPRLLADGFTMLESGRWHDNRLWVAHWASAEIVAIDPDGRTERVADAPDGYGWAFDWLPDGRMLTTGPDLTTADGTPYGHLADVAPHGWSEIVISGRGDVYVNGFEFDFSAGVPAPKPGVVAHVAPDGTTRLVAEDLRFANGMVITPDGATLLVAESFARRITAFDIAGDGTLANRRVWAENVGPDGICIDAEGAVWCGSPDIRMMGGGPDAPEGALLRVREGGEITDRLEFDRPVFSCVLGGPHGRTLFALATQWQGFENIDANAARRTGRVIAVDVAVPASGW